MWAVRQRGSICTRMCRIIAALALLAFPGSAAFAQAIGAVAGVVASEGRERLGK